MGKQGCKIGILGGSFNPAHEGHLYISQQAIELIGLDEVWWLVSPQNPLKSADCMAAFEDRFQSAVKIAKNNYKIIVSDFEQSVGTQYTCDSLQKLTDEYPENNFVWLMGADNLNDFHKWKNWRCIFSLVPIAVLNRGGSEDALESIAAKKFAAARLNNPTDLATSPAPAWCFLYIKTHPASSTEIREKN